ncbi:histidine kinase [Anaerosporomusa subterranea]|uniref:histidine kinase n=1 Tax=Anaerosporomusa subterranea TaxID=1794912 RepID=A0A154BP04_ANASB|nr:sensor histidine kinase KdpD [Anaerosporomusa subterranea]KYZ75704.1 histidine kinase [Anaerosporomusa subterranea]
MINNDNQPPEEQTGLEEKGKLTVFLGAAPGVGKTYKMLETARQRQEEGADVIIGWVETHDIPSVEQLAAALPRIPVKSCIHQGRLVREMDVDAILERKPELVLIDDIAHTNIPGSRHVRRFQDVQELLKAGIDIYTTVSIQHIESLNDIVAQITGITVKETVPDYILEQADSLQLIDIPPNELLKRIKEGKAYAGEQREQELKQFFRSGNITALRELALRFTANSVDEELEQYMKRHRINGPWPAASRIMVCVSASPFSSQLIRAAHRLSVGLHSEFIAVHVEASTHNSTDDEQRVRLARNLRLAEELGATTLTVVGCDLPNELIKVAKAHNVTAIVVGKPRHSWLQELLHGSLVEQLIRLSGGINVYVIQASAETKKSPKVVTKLPAEEQSNWKNYLGGLLMAGLVSVVSWFFAEELQPVNIALLYLMPVLLSAVWWGRWPSYVTAFLSVLLFDFLFVPPIFTFTVADIPYAWSFLIFLLVSYFIGGRTELLRVQAKTAYHRERITRALYEFSRKIASTSDSTSIAERLATHAAETFGRQTLVLLPDNEAKLSVRGGFEPEQGRSEADAKELPINESVVAQWAFEQGQVAGCSTDTFSEMQYIHVPLLSRGNAVGVMSIRILGMQITPEEQRCIDAWAGLAAISVERVKLTEAAREAAMLVEADKLHTALFNSISHELRTPLSSISGSVSTLLESGAMYNREQQTELLETIQEGASRMERIVINLLDSARLESGMLTLKKDWCDIEDLIGTTIRRFGKKNTDHIIEVDVSPDLPLIQADFVLLEQVLLNLLDNAKKYSPTDSVITIAAKQEADSIVMSVQDQGAGIPNDELVRVFDKFFRVRQDRQIPGTGLGLSICKGIVEAHRGRIWAENRPDGGTDLYISLPTCKYAPIMEAEDEAK